MRCLAVFSVIFWGCFSRAEIGKNTVILFPSQTSTDYVILKTTVEKPLKQFTVCLRSYTQLSRQHSLLSIATPEKDNAILIYPIPPHNISISINNEDIYFKVDPEVLKWKHTCVAWDSETGLLQLWVNGKRYPRRVTGTRSPIGPEMSVILGQEQDSFGGGFDASQCFVGEICDVHMWDRVLPLSVITWYFHIHNRNGNGNNTEWKEQPYELKGGVMVLED